MKKLAAVSLVLFAAVLATAVPASAVSVKHPDINYDLDSPPAAASLNQLDLYVPEGLSTTAHRPVVVFVHGGGWMRGDKSNKAADKARLFTDAGFLYASINYRLSPVGGDGSDPNRVKFPDHPHDVGEAIGWLDRHAGEFGGDPGRIILIGHSAGAHLVSLLGSDPSYYEAYGVKPAQILGVVSLDGIFDIRAYADPTLPGNNRPSDTDMYWNAFGTPTENAATNSWYDASPINFADPGDPEFLLVTQLGNKVRQANHYAMAERLGQSPDTVLLEPLDHEGINAAVGDPGDKTGETQAILSFVQRVVAQASPPTVKVRHRPSKVVRSPKKFTRVSFSFTSSGTGARFECRLDGSEFKSCHSPRAYNVKKGKHAFRVRGIVPGRSHGPTTLTRFRILPPGR